MTQHLKIGWIGAGKMGLPICLRLKAAGHHVQVLARSSQTNEKLEQIRLHPKTSVADVCKDADIVFSSVSDDMALCDIIFSTSGLAASIPDGAIFIDISTVSPSASRKVAERLEQRGVPYLRSPVSGSTMMAESGSLTAMVSGPQANFVLVQPLLAHFTRKCFYVGPEEEARYMKLVLNIMVAATSALLAEALAFGNNGGLDKVTMLDVINQSVVGSPLIAYKTDMIVKDDYRPAATLSMLQKDVDLFLATAQAGGLKPALSSHICQIYREAALHGLGEKDFFVLVQHALRSAS